MSNEDKEQLARIRFYFQPPSAAANEGTPLTDAETLIIPGKHKDSVSAEFAKRLELLLTSTRSQLEKLEKEKSDQSMMVLVPIEEHDKWEETISGLNLQLEQSRRERGPWRLKEENNGECLWQCAECGHFVSKGNGSIPSSFGHSKECSHSIQGIIEKANNAQAQLTASQSQVEQMKAELEDERGKNERLQYSRDFHVKDADLFANKCRDLESQLSQLQKERDPNAEIIALADATLDHLNPTCAAAVSIRNARSLVDLRMTGLRSALTTANATIAELQSKIAAFEEGEEIASEKLTQANELLEAERARIAKLEDTNAKYATHICELQQANTLSASDNKSLTDRIGLESDIPNPSGGLLAQIAFWRKLAQHDGQRWAEGKIKLEAALSRESSAQDRLNEIALMFERLAKVEGTRNEEVVLFRTLADKLREPLSGAATQGTKKEGT